MATRDLRPTKSVSRWELLSPATRALLILLLVAAVGAGGMLLWSTLSSGPDRGPDTRAECRRQAEQASGGDVEADAGATAFESCLSERGYPAAP